MAIHNSPSKVLPCTCHHPGQDKIHGKGMRAHNPCARMPKSQDLAYRCTVCSNKKEVKRSEQPKEEDATGEHTQA